MQRSSYCACSRPAAAILVISAIVFALARTTGDPVAILLPESASAADVERIRINWGLDQPIYVQYVKYIGNLLQGDFGEAWSFGRVPISSLLVSRLPATLQLAAFAWAISAAIALPIGVIVAVNKDSGIDYVGKIFALLGQSAPSFAIGLILMWIFAVILGWLPTSGKGGITHMILPGIALGYYNVAAVMRLTRSSMLEVLDTEYVKLARIKGMPEWKVIWKHCFRNALIVPPHLYGTDRRRPPHRLGCNRNRFLMARRRRPGNTSHTAAGLPGRAGRSYRIRHLLYLRQPGG